MLEGWVQRMCVWGMIYMYMLTGICEDVDNCHSVSEEIRGQQPWVMMFAFYLV